ncbi:MAG: ABC transporter substrate-binding protein [gamma proteobacterium symbiont of Taylorina sp.]|nr:ABC transporter substrate-binding protein [gamma proteobacterium symbiont of Taylorina sp.]
MKLFKTINKKAMSLNNLFLSFMTGGLLFLLSASHLPAQTLNDTIDIYTEHYPPHNMMIDGKLQGFSVEILAAMLKQMHSKQSLEDVKLTNWSRAYTIAQKKTNAMVFSTTRTTSRESLFKWVGPIKNTTVGVIAPKSNHIVINKPADFNQYKIGAVLKDVGETLLLEQGVDKKHIHNVEGKNAINLSFKKMQKNRIDMFSYDIGVAFANAKLEGFDISQYEVVYTLKESGLYYAFNKNTHDSIIKQWQNALDTIKENGTYDQILKKY